MDHAAPTEVVGVTTAVEVVAGATHTCARNMDGSVVCWGSNRRGELGDNMMEGHTVCTLGGTRPRAALASLRNTVQYSSVGRLALDRVALRNPSTAISQRTPSPARRASVGSCRRF